LRNSHTLGLTACALVVAASGAASAADILVGNYSVNGFTTSTTCPAGSGTPTKGAVSIATVIYPGAGKAGMVLANPATTAKSAAGTGATQVCVATGKVPAAGLNNATMTFKCYNDTEKGPATGPLATITSKFKVGASHSPQIRTVEVTTTIPILGNCHFTNDGTYSHN